PVKCNAWFGCPPRHWLLPLQELENLLAKRLGVGHGESVARVAKDDQLPVLLGKHARQSFLDLLEDRRALLSKNEQRGYRDFLDGLAIQLGSQVALRQRLEFPDIPHHSHPGSLRDLCELHFSTGGNFEDGLKGFFRVPLLEGSPRRLERPRHDFID